MSTEFDIITSFYFDDELDFSTIDFLVEYISRKSHALYGKELQTISYSYNEGQRQRNKSLKFNPKNFLKFKTDFEKEEFTGFEVSVPSKNASVKSRDHDISFHYAPKGRYRKNSSILLQIGAGYPDPKFEMTELRPMVKDLVGYISESGIRVDYGFVFPMERRKFPKFFAKGIASGDLTADEVLSANLWGRNYYNCKDKLWKVFWGNILTPEHLSEVQMHSLFGQDNVITVNQDTFLCCLPFNTFRYEDQSNWNEAKERISDFLEKNNKLIKDD